MKKNANKHSLERRPRPKGGSATHKEVFVEVKRKSQVGVEYIKYKPIIIKK